MTHFEVARKSVMNMSLVTAFCIAAYMDRVGNELGREVFEDDDVFRAFMNKTSDDIAIWLKQEDKEKDLLETLTEWLAESEET